MPINPKTKFREPSGRTGVWKATHSTRFWHHLAPFEAKFQLEKLTGILLTRDLNDTSSVTYTANELFVSYRRILHIRLEAALPQQRLYSFRIDTEGDRNWLDEEEFIEETQRVFDYWSGKLNTDVDFFPWAEATAELLARDRQKAIEDEIAAASRTEDVVAITALQTHILASVRAGAIFTRSHKEGSNTLRFNGHRFERCDEGEDPGRESFESDQQFLTAVRNFYDWESRRDTYPHRPPELNVWQYIIDQLHR